jgi:branched-chain amino acid transport system ATP-binding protein
LATDAILRIDGIVAGYGRMTVLDGTRLDISRGAITTMIGPNGAGKSTVLKAVFGLLAVRRGRIHFDGRDITNEAPRTLLDAGICYLPQGRNIFPELSVRHNLELGGVAVGRGFDFAARLDGAMSRFPVLARKAGRQASTLSGGEQKILEIARGLMLDPRLILIDEPSIGLSPSIVRDIFKILKRLRDRGVTILMVEQNARSALEISDYGIVLELGQVRLQDRAATLLEDPRVGQLFLGASLTPSTA